MLEIIVGLIVFLSRVGILRRFTPLLDRINLNKIWNLGHGNDDPDFECWEFYGHHPFKGFKKEMAKSIRELAGEGDRILSLGCGCSPILNMFHSTRVGVDINKAKLDFFRQHTDAELIEADITKMDPIGKFDIVLLTEVIEHVGEDNIDKALQLVSNSLVNGGRAVISTPDMDNSQGRIIENFLHRTIHSSLMTGTDLIERCSKCGLELRDKRNWRWDTAFLFVKV